MPCHSCHVQLVAVVVAVAVVVDIGSSLNFPSNRAYYAHDDSDGHLAVESLTILQPTMIVFDDRMVDIRS